MGIARLPATRRYCLSSSKRLQAHASITAIAGLTERCCGKAGKTTTSGSIACTGPKVCRCDISAPSATSLRGYVFFQDRLQYVQSEYFYVFEGRTTREI